MQPGRTLNKGQTPSLQTSLYVLLLLLLGCLISPVSGTICGGLTYYSATTSSQSFTSPDYPSSYGVNVYCSWLLVATDSSHVIRLTVASSSLENPDLDGNCTYDYGKAYDGSDLSATLLGEWCGSSTTTLYSTNTTMLVVFNSDYDTVSAGFSASFASGTSWPTITSEDNILVIALSVTGVFVVIGSIVLLCCIRSKLKRKKRRDVTDKEKLPKHAEENDADNEKYQSEGAKSRFIQRIVPSSKGDRRQPIAVEPENEAITRVVAANAAAAASLQQQEQKEREKREKKEAQERKKAEEKAAKEEKKAKAAEEKKQKAEEKLRLAEEKKLAATKAAEEKKLAATLAAQTAADKKKKAEEDKQKKAAEEETTAETKRAVKKKVVFEEKTEVIKAAEDGGTPGSHTEEVGKQNITAALLTEAVITEQPKAGELSSKENSVTKQKSGRNSETSQKSAAKDSDSSVKTPTTDDELNARDAKAKDVPEAGSASAKEVSKAGDANAKDGPKAGDANANDVPTDADAVSKDTPKPVEIKYTKSMTSFTAHNQHVSSAAVLTTVTAADRKTTSRAGQRNAAKAGQKATAQTGQKATAQTGQKATAQTGQKATAQTGQKNTTQAGQKDTTKEKAKPGQTAVAGNTKGRGNTPNGKQKLGETPTKNAAKAATVVGIGGAVTTQASTRSEKATTNENSTAAKVTTDRESDVNEGGTSGASKPEGNNATEASHTGDGTTYQYFQGGEQVTKESSNAEESTTKENSKMAERTAQDSQTANETDTANNNSHTDSTSATVNAKAGDMSAANAVTAAAVLAQPGPTLTKEDTMADETPSKGNDASAKSNKNDRDKNKNTPQKKDNISNEGPGNTTRAATPETKPSEVKRPGSKIVLLPTKVLLVESAESSKRKKIEGQWDKLSATRQDQFSAPGGDVTPRSAVAMTSAQMKYKADKAKAKDGRDTKVKDIEKDLSGRQRVSTVTSRDSPDKDEGINMDYEGGESGKSSPLSRPPTVTTIAPRDDNVVTPSLITSTMTDTPSHGPIPIEAPGRLPGPKTKPATSVSGPREGSVGDIEQRLKQAIQWPRETTYMSQEFSGDLSFAEMEALFLACRTQAEKNLLAELSTQRSYTAVLDRTEIHGATTTAPRPAKGAFLNVDDQEMQFKQNAQIILDRRGRPVKAAGRGRSLLSR